MIEQTQIKFAKCKIWLENENKKTLRSAIKRLETFVDRQMAAVKETEVGKDESLPSRPKE